MNELYAAAIGGAFAIIGTLVGAWLPQRFAQKQDRRNQLADCYAEVFAQYYQSVPMQDISQLTGLVAAIEKTRLFCSDESEALFKELLSILTQDNVDYAQCVDTFSKLRKSAKKDVRDR